MQDVDPKTGSWWHQVHSFCLTLGEQPSLMSHAHCPAQADLSKSVHLIDLIAYLDLSQDRIGSSTLKSG